jgi:hypothetical protein
LVLCAIDPAGANELCRPHDSKFAAGESFSERQVWGSGKPEKRISGFASLSKAPGAAEEC